MTMRNKQPIHSEVVRQAAIKSLETRGVQLKDIAEIVYEMQIPFHKDLTIATCLESVEAVLGKREVQHALLVGVELDQLAEKKMLSEPLQSIIENDESLFGCDETLAIGSVFAYGSIAMTTFGYLDKEKSGIIKKLDSKSSTDVHTFLDDMVCSIAASASSRLAHRQRDMQEATMSETEAQKKEQAG